MNSVIQPNTQSRTWSERTEGYTNDAIFKEGSDLFKLVALARPTWSDICLDIGTGAGHTAAMLAKGTGRVLGLDPAEGMVRSAMETHAGVGNLEFAYGFAHDTGVPNDSFDLITVRHAAHHFSNVPSFLKEVSRVLKPGGRVVIADEVTPNPEVDEWFDALERLRDPSHHRAYMMREWREYVNQSGLTWVVGDSETKLHIDVNSWLARANLSHEDRAAVYEHFLIASPEERSALKIKFEGNTAMSFKLPVGIMLITKPFDDM